MRFLSTKQMNTQRYIKILFLFLMVGSQLSCSTTKPESVYLRGVVQVVVGEFKGRGGNSVEQDLREALSSNDIFVIVDPERSLQLRRAYYRNRNSKDWIPVKGADAILVGEVTSHGVKRGESIAGKLLGSSEPVANVEVVFEVIDLLTGEVFGTRRIKSRVGPEGDILGFSGRLLSQAQGEGPQSSRPSEKEIITKARRNAVDIFVSSLRPDYRSK